MICPRLSMKVEFSECDRQQRFYGLKRLNFHGYRYDDSRIKERLSAATRISTTSRAMASLPENSGCSARSACMTSQYGPIPEVVSN